MKLTIDVTQEDINEGCRYDLYGKHGGCMVYRAFNRCTEGSFPYFVVEREYIRLYDNFDSVLDNIAYNVDIFLPEFVSNAISNFDKGNYVAPFSFEIDIPVGEE